jgi:hypothetical protein
MTSFPIKKKDEILEKIEIEHFQKKNFGLNLIKEKFLYQRDKMLSAIL